jgi:hypothetical protein
MRDVGAEAKVVSMVAPKKASIPFWLWAAVAALVLLTVYSSWQAHDLQRQISGINEQARAEIQKREKLERDLVAFKQEAIMRAIVTNPESTRIMLMPSKGYAHAGSQVALAAGAGSHRL